MVNAEKHRRLKEEAKANGIITQLEKNININSKANRKGFSDKATGKGSFLVPDIKVK